MSQVGLEEESKLVSRRMEDGRLGVMTGYKGLEDGFLSLSHSLSTSLKDSSSALRFSLETSPPLTAPDTSKASITLTSVFLIITFLLRSKHSFLMNCQSFQQRGTPSLSKTPSLSFPQICSSSCIARFCEQRQPSPSGVVISSSLFLTLHVPPSPSSLFSIYLESVHSCCFCSQLDPKYHIWRLILIDLLLQTMTWHFT